MSRSTRLGLFALVLALMVVCGVVEALLWVAAPVQNPYLPAPNQLIGDNGYLRMEYPRSYAVETIVDEPLPGVGGKSLFTTNRYGFRGGELDMPKPSDELRVFLVGGSTVECFYLGDDDALGAVLERDLNGRAEPGRVVRIYNVGLSGAASDDHIAMIAQRLIHLQPDMIVVMCGLNDLMRAMWGYDYLHYPRAERPLAWYQRWVARSQLGRRLIYLMRRVRPEPEALLAARTLTSRYGRLVAMRRSAPVTDRPPLMNVPAYRRNLESIVGITRTQGIRLVFVTHPSTWNSKVDPGIAEHHWMRCVEGVTYREDLMDAALEAMNLTMLDVARAHAIPVCDLATQMPRSTEYFYDDCHFNPAGASRAGSKLAECLSASGLGPIR